MSLFHIIIFWLSNSSLWVIMYQLPSCVVCHFLLLLIQPAVIHRNMHVSEWIYNYQINILCSVVKWPSWRSWRKWTWVGTGWRQCPPPSWTADACTRWWLTPTASRSSLRSCSSWRWRSDHSRCCCYQFFSQNTFKLTN